MAAANCALEFHGAATGSTYVFTATGKTKPCASGEKLCKKVDFTKEEGKLANFQVERQCGKAEGAKNQGKKNDEKHASRERTGATSASEGNAEQSPKNEKAEKSASAAAHDSREVAFLYPLLPFIALMPRRN
ncbi:hypothetical protein TRVL_09788 [Trypanosoma vivax]|nr:hypothetical protein TRVL_09788 [Trypanosoma vivax]